MCKEGDQKMRFHRRCGDRVTLLNDNTTAVRNFVEFNHGLILSADPLKDDVMFEVCIDRKVNVWNGSLEIGVTTLDPEFMELPATATKLRNTAWIMSGSSIVKDGVTLVNSYGPELDTLSEGDRVGVMRTAKAELMFYINSRCLGCAAKDLPPKLFAVIDLYGQCVQASITHAHGMRPIMESSIDEIQEDPNNDETITPSDMDVDVVALPEETIYPKPSQDVYIPMASEGACALVVQDRLRFHPRCGILVKLSANNKSAERARPLDDYNNGVVMTHRPLYDNELFEIRIDRLVDKWSGSIEVGVTSHNPATIRFPSTMTNMDSGTIMMSGCKVLLNGHGMCMEYGNFNLDELREGDTVGMMRKSNGELHYFINGVDQGIATDKVDQHVWGVVDLYGMTVKVTVVDPCEDIDAYTSNAPVALSTPELPVTNRIRQRLEEDSLLFHTLRDSNVIIINDGKTAHRPNAFEYFNNGIVMTSRTLRTNELFQVRLDLVIPKWAGSIEIGVTQQSSNDLQFPFKMSNAKSGTWAMTGEDVIRDGTIIIPQYVRNLNKLVEGDSVGVMRKDMGILHFFVNGVDQGPAAFNIPEHVFGVIDLYGRVAQATIVEAYTPPPVCSPESPLSTESNATVYPEMCFHRLHGRNARLGRGRLTASRAAVYSEFNDAVLFSARPLRECDMFELRIDKMVDCWIGSLEIGVTAIRPDDLETNGGVGAIAGTATDLSWDTYILSGAAMMKDGECVRSGYPLDLDTLSVGSRVGMMWHADRSLHYYLDGMDMGKAWFVPHLNIYAVVDLYGQCTQVTILQNEERAFNYNGCTNSDNSLLSNSRALSSPPPPYWSFSEYCGDNICLMHDYAFARRLTSDPMAALVFSSAHLAVGEIFEVKIVECKSGFAGSFRMGVTDINILNVHVNRSLPPTIALLPHYTAYIDGKYMKYSRCNDKQQELRAFIPSFDWLRPGDRVGFKKTLDGRVLVYYNSELLEVAFKNVPDKVYVVMEIFGHVSKIQAVSKGANAGSVMPQHTIPNDECIKQQPPTSDAKNASNMSAVQSTQNNSSNESVETQIEVIPEMEFSEHSNHSNDIMNYNVDLSGLCATDSSWSAPAEATSVTASLVGAESRRRRNPLPYTFHYVHGKNIRLCSSDTVAMRTSGYKDGIAIVSQPLRRGHNFRFRVDKVGGDWSGSVALGAAGALPAGALPPCAMHLAPPIWALTSDLHNDNGTFKKTQMASAFESLREQSVLTLHFRFNGELVVDVDGTVLGVVGVVSRTFSHVFPLIDLYGRVHQVSVLLHPTVVASGASLDLPIIAENLREESLAELELLDDDDDEDDERMPKLTPETPEIHPRRKMRAYSHDNLSEDPLDSLDPLDPHDPHNPLGPLDPLDPLYSQPGPSTHPDSSNCRPINNDARNKEIKCRKICSNRTVIHQSLILTDDSAPIDNNESANRCIQKSHSTHSFCQLPDEYALSVEPKESLRHTMSAGGRVGSDVEEVGQAAPPEPESLYDTNIRHNDQYPEASDADSLDTEALDALALEPAGLPDLSDERAFADDSLRRDDLWVDALSLRNFNYLNRLLGLERQREGQSLEDWESWGESCEHLHLVLKYWHFLVTPCPELRAVSWGTVRCYCRSCQPDQHSSLSGWVRIECSEGTGGAGARRAYWHAVPATLGAARAPQPAPGRRPRALDSRLRPSHPNSYVWYDEEGKPHNTVFAIEIEIEEEADSTRDRLLALLLFLRSHSALGHAECSA